MPTLQEQKRRTTVDHLAAAAVTAMVERGADVTVDEIAQVAGVSRRTVFRHFATRDELIAAAIRTALAEFARELPPFEGSDWRGWLAEILAAIHRINSSYGQVELDFKARRDLSPTLAKALAETERYRRTRNAKLAERLWHSAGHEGRPPVELIQILGTCTGPYFTFAVLRGGGADVALAGRLSHTAILAALDAT